MLIIEEIELDEEVAVYDITVPETESFYANDILVHNCSEITLHADEEHSFTCVLSSMNLEKYNEWKDTDAVQVGIVFLDCVVSEVLDLIDAKPKQEQYVYAKIRKGTEKSRALGLGVMGFHTYLQENMIPYESMECVEKNMEIFNHIHDESLQASQWLATEYGEPEWCKGFGVRNTHRTSIPPTMSCVIPSTNIMTNDGVKSYNDICDELHVDKDIFLTIDVVDDNGVVHSYEYDEVLTVQRGVETITVRAVDLYEGDDIID